MQLQQVSSCCYYHQFSCLQKRDEACFAFAAKSGARNIQERTIIVDHSFDHRAVKVESIIIIMGLYHVCLFCVSYVCNLVLFIMIGRVQGEQKQTKKKTVKRNRDSSCCCAFTLAYKRKGGEGQKRLLYKAKLCYRDQIGPFKSCQPFYSSSLIDVAAAVAAAGPC